MRADLLRQLRELGVVKGVQELATPSPRRQIAIEKLVAGHFHTTSHGRCFVAEADYPLDHRHGELPLSAFLALPPRLGSQVAMQVGGDAALEAGFEAANIHRACFIDTETTGLSGGAGTMAFVVGLGYFADGRFCLRQYFLRDPGDEPAMVEALAEHLPQFPVLVSFNGRAFDLPILENRFILARMRPPTTGLPHLDLLLPARRLWRHSLSSCSLGSLEKNVLGVLRDQDDVPSGIIPFLYRDYLRTGDARDMRRVLYHNAFDVLSMVELAAYLCRALADPWGAEGLRGGEWYSLGRWYAAAGRIDEAEQAFRAALSRDSTPEVHAKTLDALGRLFKRSGHHAEALVHWQQLALEAAPGTAEHLQAHVELAKHFEWQVGDLALAAAWTRQAIEVLERLRAGLQRDLALDELRHRLARLERKLARARPQDTPEGE